MLSKIPYSKEYEKSILNDSIEDSLKNIPPDTYEHFFLLLNEEFKKSYSSKTLTDEFKKLLKFTEQNKKFYHLYEIFSNKSKYIEFDFPNTTPQRKEEIIQSFKVSVPKPTKPEFIKKDSHYGSTSTKDTSPSVLDDALFNKLISTKAKQRSFKESLSFKTPKELAETLTTMLSNITEQNTKHIFTLASYFKQYYLLSLETFTTFIKFLNDKLKQPPTQNQPQFDIYFDFSQLTLDQLEFIIKEANNYEIIKDKNAAINEYIQKKYQSRLDALKDNPLAQRNIIYEIYTDKKTLSPYQNYSSNLLIQILTLDIKLNNMNLDIFLQYLQNPTNNNSYETQTMFNKNIQKQLLSNNSLFTLNNVNISMDSFHDNTLIKEYLHYFFYNKLATVETFNKYLEEKFLQKQYFLTPISYHKKILFATLKWKKIGRFYMIFVIDA